ncbi:nesprin-1-like [Oreochromis aureus]|uniref:nesprin-1-like n=1 Tax=Oreochromis aureus TaxID=47969 RepID=UPI0019539454|nr:nesprin-1-like [Oreochromis aureus]
MSRTRRRKLRMRRKKSSRSIFRDLYDVIERRRREGRPRLIQLDSLTRRSRTLTRVFQGTLQTRLLALARECGRGWDDVNAKQESITGRLQLLVSEWEGFEAQREELVIWLAVMDVHLSEVDQLTGNTCGKTETTAGVGLF